MAGRKGPGASHDEVALSLCTCVNAPTDRTTEPQPPHRHEHTAHFSHGLTGPRRRGRAAVQVRACCLNLSHLPKHLGGRRKTEGPST